MENEDDTNLLAQLQDALDACELQHQREQGLLRQIDDQLKASDGYLRSELQAIVSRSRERRSLLASEVIDAVFELVGEREQDQQPPPLPNFSELDPYRPHMQMDDDPLLLGINRRFAQ